MGFFLKNKRGETLSESIIALLVLATGITFSGVVMANSLSNITSSKSRIIAVNIARESIEATRNLRDTNWLKFSGNRRNCWNHLPGPLPDTCDGSKPIEVGTYVVYKDENKRWRLKPHLIDGAFDNASLYHMDIDPNRDTNGDGKATNDPDLFNHRITKDNNPVGENGGDPLGYLNSEKTAFKRTIAIDYLDNNNVLLSVAGGGLTETHNRMVITTKVTWIQNSRESTVELKTHLTDYLGRDNFDN